MPDNLASGTQYTQNQLPGNLFNISNGDVVNYNGQSYKGTVNGNGTRSFDPYVDTTAYDNLLGTVKNAASTFDTGLNQNEDNAYNDYLHTVQSQPTSVDFYNQQLNAAGVPQLQKTSSTLQGQIFNLEDTLKRVEPNVTATTGNSLVTDAQRQGLVAAQQKPLNEQLGTLGTAEGRITDAITQGKADALSLTNLNSADQQKLVDAYKEKLTLAQSQGDRALQAFTSDITNTLNVTLAKIQRGEAVSDTEAANAFALLKIKDQAAADISVNAAKPAAADNSNRYISVGDGSEIYDTQTGTIVANNPKTSTAAGNSGAAIGGGSTKAAAGF